MMDCKQAKSLFSTYLDGAVTGRQMRAIATHLESCGSCHTSYYSLQRTQAMLSSLPTRKAPVDLALRINVAIQRERTNNLRFTLQRIVVRLENALNAFMLPATAGLVTAVVMFGILIGFFAVQVPQGNNNDVPTLLYTPPRLASGPFDIQGLEGPVLIDASVDPTGRVDDYEILSGHDSEALRVKIDNALIFTQFEPARAFGAPASGHVVLAFSSVNVKG